MSNTTKTANELIPAISLRGLVVFPAMVLHFDIGRERSVNAVNRFLFVKSPQAGAIRFFPRFRFVHIMHFPFICFIIALACTKKHNYELWRLQA